MGYSSRVYSDWSGRWHVSISTGNTKVLKVPGIAIDPVSSCRKDAPCRKACYAMKAYRQYGPTRDAWNGNGKAARYASDFFFGSVDRFLEQYKPKYFRVHVAGDFYNDWYMLGWYILASKHPGTRFLAFTKRYDLLSVKGRPSNFQLVISAWPGLKLPRSRLPVAFMQDGTEKRPRALRAMPCQGHCETCAACWHLSSTGRDVIFNLH